MNTAVKTKTALIQKPLKAAMFALISLIMVIGLSSCTYLLSPNQYSVSSYVSPTGTPVVSTTYGNSFFVPSRGNGSSYVVGEQIRFQVQSPQSGYMSLTAIDPDGVTYVFEENVPVRAGQSFSLPDSSKSYVLTPPRGLHRVQAAFSTQPISNAQVIYYVDQNGSVFRVQEPNGTISPNQVKAEANIVLESHFYLR